MRFGIRRLDPDAPDEIELVARRWEETLVEVLGPERAAHELASKPDDWVVQHVRRHVGAADLTGEVYVADTDGGAIAGHCVVRLDDDGAGSVIGLFATIFVAPEHRRQGLAGAFIEAGEQWFRDHGMTRAMTYTDHRNAKLHELFARHGYGLEPMPNHFVALSKSLGGTGSRR